MKKINQRWLSATMAMAMAASMTVPALAADTTVDTTGEDGKYSAKTSITGELEAPTIKLTVPQTGTVIINPYKMTVNSEATGNEDVSDQIISATQFIKNESDVDINVSATVIGKPAEDGEAVLATSALKGSETTKSVFMYLEIGESSDGSTDPSWKGSYVSSDPSMVAVTSKSTTKANMYTLKADVGSTPTYAGFRLNGAAASKPTKAWTDKDKVDVEIAFTFDPVAATGEAGAD